MDPNNQNQNLNNQNQNPNNQNDPQNPRENQNQDPNNQNKGNSSSDKHYSQQELNNLLANEKRTARNALLKELGFDIKDDKSYKDTVSNIKKTLDAGKTQQQLDKEAKEAAEAARGEAEGKVADLELQVAALKLGVNPEYLDDIIALARPKIDESHPLDKVMEELKKRYPDSFETGSSDKGTGNPANPKRPNSKDKPGSYGQGLAKANGKPSAKSSYFKK